jgi:hypothetical protein
MALCKIFCCECSTIVQQAKTQLRVVQLLKEEQEEGEGEGEREEEEEEEEEIIAARCNHEDCLIIFCTFG